LAPYHVTRGALQVAGMNTSSALAAFEKMEDKVLAMEAEAEAAMQVGRAFGPAGNELVRGRVLQGC
jgi:phage shock protein A